MRRSKQPRTDALIDRWVAFEAQGTHWSEFVVEEFCNELVKVGISTSPAGVLWDLDSRDGVAVTGIVFNDDLFLSTVFPDDGYIRAFGRYATVHMLNYVNWTRMGVWQMYVEISVIDADAVFPNNDTAAPESIMRRMLYDQFKARLEDYEREATEYIRDLARGLHAQLREEYDYITSTEYALENLRANDSEALWQARLLDGVFENTVKRVRLSTLLKQRNHHNDTDDSRPENEQGPVKARARPHVLRRYSMQHGLGGSHSRGWRPDYGDRRL